MIGPAAEATIHRALADPHRAGIVDELRRHPDGLDARELGRRLALHPNTIRWHLAILVDAGVVASRPEERTVPGRPRVLFSLNGTAESTSESYRLLASLLTGALSELPDGAERAAAAGRAWGGYLVRRPPPHVRLADEQAIDQVVGLLSDEGFRAEASADGIRMHSCPFRDLVEHSGEIVCAAHRGLVDGALDGLDSGVEVDRLDVFAEPGVCVASLRRRP